MQKLWETLEHGFVGTGLVRIPVAGDLNKLIYAHGLTANERKIAQQTCFYAQNMPGNQTVRRLMGAAAQGARGVLVTGRPTDLPCYEAERNMEEAGYFHVGPGEV